MTEVSREDLLAQADELEAEAVAHDGWGRGSKAQACRDEAERLRALAEGAPVGPSPDTIDAAIANVQAKLDEAKDLLVRAIDIYSLADQLIVKLLRGAAEDLPAPDALEPESAPEPAAEFDIGASVPKLLDYVGDDPAKAQAVLDAEQAAEHDDRSTLVEPLQAIVDAAKANG